MSLVDFFHLCNRCKNSEVWIIYKRSKKILNIPININHKSQTSNTAPCNGIVSLGAQFEGLRVFANHAQKNKHKAYVCRIFVLSAVFYACLSSCSDCSRCSDISTWQTTVILIMRKNPKTPNLSPCWDKDSTGSGISGLYLWTYLNIYEVIEGINVLSHKTSDL